MRADFQAQLQSLRADLAEMCGLAGDAISRATTGLLDVDADAAGRVVVDASRLRFLHNTVERRSIGILARQAPVAGDLRTVVTAITVAADADRMGGLATHVAKVCLRRHPEPVVPDELRGRFERMGDLAERLAMRCRTDLLAGDCTQVEQVRHDDRTVEVLHRELFAEVMSPRWTHGAGAAMDVVLLGRFYGRFADHAAEIGRRMVFQAGGSAVGRQSAG